MPHRARLLGFAFANADFLFEIDATGTILFASGAVSDLVRESSDALVGAPAGKLFKPAEGVKFATLVKALKDGQRAGPFPLTLAGGQDAQLSLFRLPHNGGAISCTLARPGVRGLAAVAANDHATGLKTKDGFLAAIAGMASADDTLTLVEVPGLAGLCENLSPDNAAKLLQSIGATFEQSGAVTAGRLSDSRFGAVATASKGPLGLARLVAGAISGAGLKAPTIKETQVGLTGHGLSGEQRLLAIRYVVDRFAEKGRVAEGDIAASFAVMLDDTQKRLTAMTQTTAEGAFDIAYQPISALATGVVSHYEALARFTNKEGTGETVKFIEALGIANAFDIAVATKVMELVARDGRPHVHVAFNISGATLASPASFGMLAGLLARRRALAPRILIEITETAAIADLEAAGKAIAALRAMGYRVGLDDFGAGAASVNYLHAFQVDFVKFDGAMIQKIGTSARDDALLAGLAKLCGEMGLETIAEWIETDTMAGAARLLGFSHGQGRYLGAPLLEIPADVVTPGKRRGLKESWG